MDTSIQAPPRTIMEVYKSLPEGTLAELIDNVITMSPSPVSKHQRVSNRINNRLFNYIEQHSLGEVFVAPMDVYLDDHSNAVQPDIIVILNENLNIIDPEGHIHGTPDFLVEVLSPGNLKHDQVTKKELYERFGVKEYWIVDPETQECTGYKLVGKSYELLPVSTGVIHSPLLGAKFDF